MKKIITGLLSLLFSFGAFAQQYAVEVGAFATAPQEGYFKKIVGVYETLDVNYIYRYYKDAANKEAAEKILSEVKEAGFFHARIINFDDLKAQCNVTCDYVPPKKTGKTYKILEPKVTPLDEFYPIFFDFDKYYLTPESKEELNKYINYLKNNPSHKLQLYAHTDSKGNVDYNKNLSENRAKTAIKYLTDRGVAASRLSKTTMGEGDPAAKNESASGGDLALGRKLNRRIEFKILDNSGKVLNIVEGIKVPSYLK